MRGATRPLRPTLKALRHFNPRSSCEERRQHPKRRQRRSWHFNPRSSCEERPHLNYLAKYLDEFQSTLLMRGATTARRSRIDGMQHFNPRSSCEERHSTMLAWYNIDNFNPRSSCEERPAQLTETQALRPEFQSTLLMRGATGTPVIKADGTAEFQSTLLMRGATGRSNQL